MDLSGQQRRELKEAFIDAFPDKASLEQMLSFELDKNLDAIAGGGSLENIVFSLIKTAAAQGWVLDLIDAAHRSNPRNQRLKAIAEQFLQNGSNETPSSSLSNTSGKQQSHHTSYYNFSNAKFGGGFAGTGGTQTGGTFYDYSSNQNFTEAAAQIQQLLKQLQQTNPSITETEKIIVAAKAAEEINNNPTLKARVIGALKSGGKEAFKEAVDNPIVNVLVAIIEGWQEAE
ncbi:MAG: effector-associated domain EAD1-containing protein [Scytonema sp. PMC 1069.18]|nr:effector-associated domain EAD1-containing protein [Scytonema sp. PMC 1069.18]MEC4882452.1 effector-associated domain EAD1-containing protein [Scytonema sp. PMC 1070.18]